MHYTTVTAEEFALADGLDDWQLSGETIRADFRAGSFTAAAALIPPIADAAEALDHHPDIDIRYPDHVVVTCTTHVTHGLTTHDIDLARAISRLVAERA